MSQKTDAALKVELDAYIFENVSRLITATNTNAFLTDIIDSKVNKNSTALGLKEFNSANPYAVGDGVLYQGTLYQCTTAQLASWNPANFTAIASLESLATSVKWVDPILGDDTTGDGTIYKPYKLIQKGLTSASAGQNVWVLPGVCLEPLTVFSAHTIADNVTIWGFSGCTLQGPSMTDPSWRSYSQNGSTAFVYTVDQAKKFSIKGYFDFVGDFGLFSCDNDGASVYWEVNTYKQTAATGAMSNRTRKGYSNGLVKCGDMLTPDQQGIFFGPGTGYGDLNVLNGEILMYKTSTVYTSDQTRLIQIRNSTGAGPINITCNGIRSIVDGDHSFTDFVDLFYMESAGSTVNLNIRGKVKEVSTPNDGDFSKKYGQNGCIIINGGGTLNLNGDVESLYTQGITTIGSVAATVTVNGKILTTYSSAVKTSGTSTSSKIYLNGPIQSSGLAPTIDHDGANKLFIRDSVVNTNAGAGTVAILYNGSNLVFKAGSGMTSNGTCFTTEIASRTYKMLADVPYNKELSASPVSKILLLTVSKVVSSQIYSVTINGTPYTFTSSGAATATNIATGLTAAIGAPAGVASVVDNGAGTITVTATAGTNLTMVDSTSWTTQFKWYIPRSITDDVWTLTINGTSFTFTSTDTTWYHLTGGGIPNIRDSVKALVQANAGIDALIGTYQVDKYGLTLISSGGNVFTTISGSGNAYGYTPDPQKPLLVTTVNAGYLGGMANSIGGTSFNFDADVEF